MKEFMVCIGKRKVKVNGNVYETNIMRNFGYKPMFSNKLRLENNLKYVFHNVRKNGKPYFEELRCYGCDTKELAIKWFDNTIKSIERYDVPKRFVT